MNTAARHRVPAIVAIYAAIAFVLIMRGKIPGAYYSFLLSALLMLASILWAAGDLSVFREGDGRWIFTNSMTVREHEGFSFSGCALMFGAISMLAILPKPGFYIVFALCYACVPVCTQILLGAASVSRYLDSLGVVSHESVQQNFSATERSEILKAFTVGRWLGPLLLVYTIFISAVLRLYDMFQIPAALAMSAGVFFSVFVSVMAVSFAASLFGIALNFNLALCGLKRESELSGDCARDDELFEANRTFAHHAKHVAVTLAFVLYPAMFYVLYLLLSSQ